MDKEDSSRKTKKIPQRLNPTALNQSQKHEKGTGKSKKKKNSWEPKTDDLKPKALTLTKNTSVEKQKEFMKA